LIASIGYSLLFGNELHTEQEMWPSCPTLWCNESWWKWETSSFLLSFNLFKSHTRVSLCWWFAFRQL